MTPEQKLIAIAEACGWTGITIQCRNIACGVPPTSRLGPAIYLDGKWFKIIPDYLNDLNAMHEAEKTLSRNDKQKYLDILADAPREDIYYTWADSVFATAAQRAEAFLKAIGKYES
jgi:hypothetical protein